LREVPQGKGMVELGRRQMGGGDGAGMAQDLHVRLAARPESLAAARHALRDWLDEAGWESERALDVELAAGEAVANVIRHAYPDSAGDFELAAAREPEAVWVTVRDEGCGAPPAPQGARRLGLPLMQTLAEEVRLTRRPGLGTEVRLRFRDRADARGLGS
jgi:anti-sigma regulatory factor (Ser/Thr protein kinase)